jgi:two-component system, cell cycle response regulator
METPTRVLVIEDNRANLDLTVYLLEAFGYAPLMAMDGEEGMEVAHREHPDLILCDVDLPKLDGYGVLKKLKSEPAFSHVPIVAVTALAMVSDRDKMLKCGFTGYLSKPITPETFIEQIERFMALGLRAERMPPVPSASVIEVGVPSVVEKDATILVVDDKLSNLSFAHSILELSGFRVFTARNVFDAIKLAQAHETDLDLIVSDLIMPPQTGYDLIEQLRAIPHLADIPIGIISSTYVTEQYRIEARIRGAAFFIVCPVEPQVLLAQIATALESNRQRAPRRRSEPSRGISPLG